MVNRTGGGTARAGEARSRGPDRWRPDPGLAQGDDDEPLVAWEAESGSAWERMLEALQDGDDRADPPLDDGVDALRAFIAERLGTGRLPTRRR
jgi:hypothetical protein